jgi:hypothetical protein
LALTVPHQLSRRCQTGIDKIAEGLLNTNPDLIEVEQQMMECLVDMVRRNLRHVMLPNQTVNLDCLRLGY